MAETVYVLSAADRAALDEMLAWWQRTRGVDATRERRGCLPRWVDRRMKGKLYGSMSTGSTGQLVDNVAAIIGVVPTTGTSETVMVANVHHWAADDDADVRFEWCRSSSQWEFYQVNCPS